MPFLRAIRQQINRKFCIQFCTPTEDICTIDSVLKYLNPQASYVLIPGVQNSSIYDPQKLLLQILPYTENIILDICLPYVQINRRKNAIRHFGRYIICNQQIVGIRIKPSEHWPRSKCSKQPISNSLQNFYKDHGVIGYPKQILLGQFVVSTKHFKLAPFFQSQLSSLSDNTARNILTQYYSLGCQIFSIINDLTQEKKKNLKSPFQILRNYRRQSTIVVYCGMHLATELNEFYKTQSYAVQTSDTMKRIKVDKFDEIYTQSIIIDLDMTKINRKSNTSESLSLVYSDVQILDCKNFRVKFSFHEIHKNQFQEPMQIEEQSQLSKRNHLILAYLWYLYVNVNNRSPFSLPCPMNDKDEILLRKIIQLSQHTNVDKHDLINFIKIDPKAKLHKKYQSENFKIVSLERVIRQTQPLYLCFNLKQRMSLSSIQKQQNCIVQMQKRLINIYGCIGGQLFKIIQNQSSSQTNKIGDEDQKFIEKFLRRKSGGSLELFYYQMTKYYPRGKINPDFLSRIYQGLKSKVNKQFSGTSFQIYIMHSSFQSIQRIFAECEQRLFFGVNLSTKAQEDQILTEENQNQQNTFRNFIKKVKYHCNSQKKSNFICHMCGSLFSRKQKSTYGRFCFGCSNFVCYSCFDNKTGQIAQSEQIFQQCLVCQSKCDCDKCLKKKHRVENINMQNIPSKHPNSNPKINASSLVQNKTITQVKIIEQKGTKQTQMPVKSQFKQHTQNIPKDQSSHANTNQLTNVSIKPCWQCQLSNRVDRIIVFQCNACKDFKCLSCEKAGNNNRSWILRGNVICNKCLDETIQNQGLKSQVKKIQSRMVGLQQEIAQLRRQKFLSTTFNNNNFFGAPIIQETSQNEGNADYQHKNQRGCATPIFQRPMLHERQSSQSPTRNRHKNPPSQNGSIASFGGQKTNGIAKQKVKLRKNSSNSSGSRSPPSKKSNPNSVNKLIQRQEKSKRKNSSGSQKASVASFHEKKGKTVNNSSKGSISSKRSQQKKKGKNSSERSSVESGQYNGSISSQKDANQQKSQWKNCHQNNNRQQGNFERGRGQGRGRGRGSHQGGNFDRKDSNNQGDNKFQSKQFSNQKHQSQNTRGQGTQKQDNWSKNNQYNQKRQDRDNGQNSKGKFNDWGNSQKKHQNNYNDQQNQQKRSRNQEDINEGYLIIKPRQNKDLNTDDFDY